MCSVWHEMFKIASISVAEGAYDAPSDSLRGPGFLPSAIAASRLWRLQFPGLGRALVGGIASITQGGIDATESVKYTAAVLELTGVGGCIPSSPCRPPYLWSKFDPGGSSFNPPPKFFGSWYAA